MSKKNIVSSSELGNSSAASNVVERMTQAVKNAHTAIQLLKNENDQLKEENQDLKKKIDELEKKLNNSQKLHSDALKHRKSANIEESTKIAVSSWNDQTLSFTSHQARSQCGEVQKGEVDIRNEPDIGGNCVRNAIADSTNNSSKELPDSNSVPSNKSAPPLITHIEERKPNVTSIVPNNKNVPKVVVDSSSQKLTSAPVVLRKSELTVEGRRQNLEKGWGKIIHFSKHENKKTTKKQQHTSEKDEMYYYLNLLNENNYYTVAWHIMQKFQVTILMKWIKEKLSEDINNRRTLIGQRRWKIEEMLTSSPAFIELLEECRIPDYVRLLTAFGFFHKKGGRFYSVDILCKLKASLISDIRNRASAKSWEGVFHSSEMESYSKPLLSFVGYELKKIVDTCSNQAHDVSQSLVPSLNKEEIPENNVERRRLLAKLLDLGDDDDDDDEDVEDESDSKNAFPEDDLSHSAKNDLNPSENSVEPSCTAKREEDEEQQQAEEELSLSDSNYGKSVEATETKYLDSLSIDNVALDVLFVSDIKDYALSLIFVKTCLMLSETNLIFEFLEELTYLTLASHQMGISCCLLVNILRPSFDQMSTVSTTSLVSLITMVKIWSQAQKKSKIKLEDEKISRNVQMFHSKKILSHRLGLLDLKYQEFLAFAANSIFSAPRLKEGVVELIKEFIYSDSKEFSLEDLLNGYPFTPSLLRARSLPIILQEVGIIPSYYTSLLSATTADILSVFGFGRFPQVMRQLFQLLISAEHFYLHNFVENTTRSSGDCNLLSEFSDTRLLEVFQMPFVDIEELTHTKFDAILNSWKLQKKLEVKNPPRQPIFDIDQYWRLQSLFGHSHSLYESIYFINYQQWWTERSSQSHDKRILYFYILQLKSDYFLPIYRNYHSKNNNSFNNNPTTGWRIGDSGEGTLLSALWISKKPTMLKLINEIIDKLALFLPKYSLNPALSSCSKDCDDYFSYEFMQSSTLSSEELGEIGNLLDFIFHQLLPRYEDHQRHKVDQSSSTAQETEDLGKKTAVIAMKQLFSHAIKALQLVILVYFERYFQAIKHCLKALLFLLAAEIIPKKDSLQFSSSEKIDEWAIVCIIEVIRFLWMIPLPFGIHDDVQLHHQCLEILSFLSMTKVSSDETDYFQDILALYTQIKVHCQQEVPVFMINLPRRSDRWLKCRLKLEAFKVSHIIRFPAHDGFHLQKDADKKIVARIQQFYQQEAMKTNEVGEEADLAVQLVEKERGHTINTENEMEVSDDWDCFLHHQMNCADIALKQQNQVQRVTDSDRYHLTITKSEKAVIHSHLNLWKQMIFSQSPQTPADQQEKGTVDCDDERNVLQSYSFFPAFTSLSRSHALLPWNQFGLSFFVVITDEVHVNTKLFNYQIPPSISLTCYVQHLIESLPEHWDFLCLGGEFPPHSKSTRSSSSSSASAATASSYLFQELPTKKYFNKINYVNKIYGYVIHRKMIEKLFNKSENLLPFRQPFEAYLSSFFFQEEFNAYSLKDPLFIKTDVYYGSNDAEKTDSNVVHSYLSMNKGVSNKPFSSSIGKKRQNQHASKQGKSAKKVKFAI